MTELLSRSMVLNTMRRLIAIFLIAVLPVRAWAVDLMGVSMAAQALSTQSAPAEVAPNQVAMPPDCPVLAMGVDGPSDTGNPQEPVSPLCQGCTACQLCMAVVSGPPIVLTASEPQRHSRPAKGEHGFASASLRAWLKPPIG